jgi:hypothetical protein
VKRPELKEENVSENELKPREKTSAGFCMHDCIQFSLSKKALLYRKASLLSKLFSPIRYLLPYLTRKDANRSNCDQPDSGHH